MNIILYPDPILLQPTQPIPENGMIINISLLDIVNEMTTLLYKLKGRGLAAPQVGLSYRLFICILGRDNLTVFINPEIIGKSEKKIKSLEGCLSIPNITANLNCRYEEIRIRAEDINREPFELLLSSYDSVVVQHEQDHLFQTVLFNRMGSAQRTLKKNVYRKKQR